MHTHFESKLEKGEVVLWRWPFIIGKHMRLFAPSMHDFSFFVACCYADVMLAPRRHILIKIPNIFQWLIFAYMLWLIKQRENKWFFPQFILHTCVDLFFCLSILQFVCQSEQCQLFVTLSRVIEENSNSLSLIGGRKLNILQSKWDFLYW